MFLRAPCKPAPLKDHLPKIFKIKWNLKGNELKNTLDIASIKPIRDHLIQRKRLIDDLLLQKSCLNYQVVSTRSS